MGYRTPSLLYSNFPHAFGLMPDLTVFFPGCLYASTAVLLVWGWGGVGNQDKSFLIAIISFQIFFIIFLYANFQINLKVSLHSSREDFTLFIYFQESFFIYVVCMCAYMCLCVPCVQYFQRPRGGSHRRLWLPGLGAGNQSQAPSFIFYGNHITFLYYSEEINIFTRF